MSYKLVVNSDEYAENPRDNENLCKMVFPVQNKEFPVELTQEELKDTMKDGFCLPVFVLDHSGLAFSMETDFSHLYMGMDSGFVGFICATRKDICEIFGEITPDILSKVQEIAKTELALYQAYVNGRMYLYRILNDETGEVLETGAGYLSEAEARTDGIGAMAAYE